MCSLYSPVSASCGFFASSPDDRSACFCLCSSEWFLLSAFVSYVWRSLCWSP